MTEEEQDEERQKQTIIKNLFEKGTIRKVTQALFTRCGLNWDTKIGDDIISETFLQLSKMPAKKLIEIAKNPNWLDAYSINMSKNVGVLLSAPKREKPTVDKDGNMVKGEIIIDGWGNEIRPVSKQKMVEYLRFGSSFTSTNIINVFDEFEANYTSESQNANIILVNEEDDNTFQLLFEKIKEHVTPEEMIFIEEMLQKKHKKKNVEKDYYLFLIEKIKLKVHNKMKDKEQEIKQLVINIIPTLYEFVNKQRDLVSGGLIMDIKAILEGRMMLGHIPYTHLNTGCGDCVKEMIYQIISWYETPAFQPPVVDEPIPEETEVTPAPVKKSKAKVKKMSDKTKS